MQVLPLGGLEEIGKNMTALRQKSGMILVDAGMAFPDEEMPGIDLILPDFSYVRDHAEELKGIVVTHGHEDHVGAIPYLLREFNVPVYATKLTLGLIRAKLKEFGIKKADLREVKGGDKMKLAGFGMEFIEVNHSVPDAVSIALRTAAGLVVFSGDYKIDHTPVDGRRMDLARFAGIGDEGVLAFFGDSTNSERPGHTPSERVVSETLDRLIESASGRVVVASFASHLHRIAQVIEAARRHGRLVGVAGRSMVRNVGIARELGYIDLPSSMMVEQKDINSVPDSDIVVLMTGSQGEPLAALSRVANGTHKTIEAAPGDSVIVAAHPIPGNEKGVARTINNLMKRGAHVHYSPLEDVHVSGHASQEEQKTMLSLLKPRYLVPVHGEYKHLYHHVQTAKAMGMPGENIFVMQNGDGLEFADGGVRRLEPVGAGMFFVDAGTVTDTAESIMRERQQLSGDGMFIVVARVNAQNGQLLGEPDVISRGFVNQQEANGLVGASIEVVTKTLERTAKKQINDRGNLKTEIRRDLSGFLNKRTQKRPVILPVIIEL